MANAVFGEARLSTADGRDLTLRYDFNALCEIEEAAGASFGEVNQKMLEGRAGLKLIRAALFGGLRAHHPELTLGDAGDLLLSDGNTTSLAMQQAMTAMSAGSGANPPKGAGRNSGPPRGTGTRSSRSGAKPG